MQQLTKHILMIRPAHFGYNAQTAVNNAFQSSENIADTQALQQAAILEFDAMVQQLRSKGIDVFVVDDTPSPEKPDAVFPNNWVSFHENGSVVTYPMFAPNRRIERRDDILEKVGKVFRISNRYSLEIYEDQKPPLYLEGTGSMVLDRAAGIAYACLSPRTDAGLVDTFCNLTGMKPCLFTAQDKNGKDIYHTNVMMAVGEEVAVVCLDSIPSATQRKSVVSSLEQGNKKIIPISLSQMEQFAGNMLEVMGDDGQRYLCMSETAYKSLDEHQIYELNQRTNLLPITIPYIEKYGGGSVRCMMAEIFLPIK